MHVIIISSSPFPLIHQRERDEDPDGRFGRCLDKLTVRGCWKEGSDTGTSTSICISPFHARLHLDLGRVPHLPDCRACVIVPDLAGRFTRILVLEGGCRVPMIARGAWRTGPSEPSSNEP